MTTKIETEYKLELSKEEFFGAQEKVVSLGFKLREKRKIKDYFFNLKKFDDKGWNFTRIRVYDDKQFEKTQKTWLLDDNGERIREEKEADSSLSELTQLMKNEKNVFLEKERTDYGSVKILGYQGTISFDEVYLRNDRRYFVECELETPKKLSHQIRPKIKNWMLENLDLTDRSEGIGMLRLALSNQEEYVNYI